MSVLPQSRREQITWFQNRLSLWENNSDSIGLSELQVGELSSKVAQAAAALGAAEVARDTSRSKTLEFHESTDDLRTFGAGLIKTIKAFAASSGDSSVYALANIPAPAPPSPAPPPEAPTDVVTTVNNDGSIALRWRFVNVAGTAPSFQIFRKIAGQSHYTFLASTAQREFTDTTVAPGTPSVSYMLRTIRSAHASEDSEPVTVYFGYVKKDGPDELQLAA